MRRILVSVGSEEWVPCTCTQSTHSRVCLRWDTWHSPRKTRCHGDGLKLLLMAFLSIRSKWLSRQNNSWLPNLRTTQAEASVPQSRSQVLELYTNMLFKEIHTHTFIFTFTKLIYYREATILHNRGHVFKHIPLCWNGHKGHCIFNFICTTVHVHPHTPTGRAMSGWNPSLFAAFESSPEIQPCSVS